jgi:F0F1-type ATP synthase membrane subunit b/b'
MGEALQAALRDIAERPWPFVAEVAHFLLLAALVAWAARRPIARRLAARRDAIAASLSAADEAEREAAAMRAQAAAVPRDAEAEVPLILAAARAEAERQRQATIAEGESEAERLLREASQAVDADRTRAVQEASERLIRLTTETARRYLDEMLTEGERRALTEKAILESLGELERGPPGGTPSGR